MDWRTLFVLMQVWSTEALNFSISPKIIGTAAVPDCSYKSCNTIRLCNTGPRRLAPYSNIYCACDNDCLLFGDCCYDFFTTCLNTTMSKAADQELKNPSLNMTYIQRSTCKTVETGTRGRNFMIVSTCPTNSTASKFVVDSCEDENRTVISQVPVTLKTHPSVTFANYHCALCHGLARHELRFWRTDTYCDGPPGEITSVTKLNEMFKKYKCAVQVSPNANDHPRACRIGHDDQTSPASNSDLGNLPKLCRMYTYPVVDQRGKEYKNIHCAEIAERASNVSLKCRCQRFYPKRYPIPPAFVVGSDSQNNIRTVGGLSVLFNFGERDFEVTVNGRIIKSVTRLCPRENEVYIAYTDRCVVLHCDELDKKPVNGTCVLKDNLVMDSQNQLYPEGSNILTIKLWIRHDNLTMAEEVVENYLVKNGFSLLNEKHTQVYNSSDDDGAAMLVSGLSYVIHLNDTDSEVWNIEHLLAKKIDDLLTKKRKRFNITRMSIDSFQSWKPFNYTIFEYFEKLLSSGPFCSNDTIPELYKNINVVAEKGTSFAKVEGVFYDLRYIPFEMNIDILGNVSSATDVIICIPWKSNITLDCPNGTIGLLSSEYVMENGTLRVGSDRFESNDYCLTKEGAVVCNLYSRSGQKDQYEFFDYDNVQTILTIVTSLISVLSLLLTIIVYIALPELLNVPGKVVVSFSATLIFSQVLLLVLKLPTGKVCAAVALGLHTLWLSVFMWMTMLSIDLARSLWKMEPVYTGQKWNKRFLLYAIASWGIPILFVGSCFLLDQFHVLDVAYGHDYFCWITNRYAALYVFGVPIALTLAVNLICFVMTLVSIEQTTSRISGTSKSCKNEKNKLAIYVRLMFIMGLIWILSFVAGFLRLKILWYFQIIFNGLSGFYILVCFVCKGRILQKMTNKLNLLRKESVTRESDINSINLR